MSNKLNTGHESINESVPHGYSLADGERRTCWATSPQLTEEQINTSLLAAALMMMHCQSSCWSIQALLSLHHHPECRSAFPPLHMPHMRHNTALGAITTQHEWRAFCSFRRQLHVSNLDQKTPMRERWLWTDEINVAACAWHKTNSMPCLTLLKSQATVTIHTTIINNITIIIVITERHYQASEAHVSWLSELKQLHFGGLLALNESYLGCPRPWLQPIN